MPVLSEKYVELTCVQSATGFIAPLILNLALMTACTVLAALCRKLFDNFRESWLDILPLLLLSIMITVN